MCTECWSTIITQGRVFFIVGILCIRSITNLEIMKCAINQQAHGPQRSPEYQRLYTDFLLGGLIFAYQKAHHNNKKKNQ